MKCNKTYLAWALIAITDLLLPNTSFGKNKSVETVFVTNYLRRGRTSTEPTPEQLTDKRSVFVEPSEYEPVTVSIRAGIELKGLQVKLVEDLKNKAGDVIPASAVDINPSLPPWPSGDDIAESNVLSITGGINSHNSVDALLWTPHPVVNLPTRQNTEKSAL